MARIKKTEAPRREPVAAPIAPPPDIPAKWSLVAAILLILIGTARIVSTYTVYNHTVDEAGNIACGMEWLEKGVYRWEAQHPPLARVMSAIGPYLAGARGQGTPKTNELLSLWKEGVGILYASNNYDRTLALARAGMLPFFWVACSVVYLWGCRYFSRLVGVVALFLFSFVPPVLAHAGLTNNDMAITAFLSAAFLAGMIWLEEPTVVHGIWFGLTAGLMVVSKFSCFAFFPAAVALGLIGYYISARPSVADMVHALRRRVPTLAMAIGISLILIWSVYRFSHGRLSPGGIPVPFPELFLGIREVSSHLDQGHDSYLLGETGRFGFWNFYPVAIGVKTPLAFLILLAIGLVLWMKRDRLARGLWMPLMFSLGVLLVGMTSSINIGVRHVLPVYVGFSIIAAVAAVKLFELGSSKKWVWGILGGLILWMAASSGLAHPDYLPYFNELAGSHPEDILVDSDLDWGQDIKRLGRRLQELGATSVAYNGYDWADLGKHGFPKDVHGLDRRGPVPGYNAISITCWKEMRVVDWPDQVPPTERVGKGMLLWYVPPVGGR
jgi:hypothetical protein